MAGNIDFNSDREGHVDHKWEVIKATTRELDALDVDGKQMRFGKDGAFRVTDPGVAAAIRQTYGRRGDVTVTRIRYPHVSDRGHTYLFSVPALPWKEGKDGEEKELDQGCD